MKVLLTSDTHGPRSAPLPGELLDAAAAADVVVHAGDWCDVETWEQLRAVTRELVGVVGNNDGPDLRAVMPEVAEVVIAGLQVVVVHESGAAGGRDRRCARRFPATDLIVFGHSHVPWCSTINIDNRSMHIINPESPTEPRRQPRPSFMIIDIVEGKLLDASLHHLPRTTATQRRRGP